MNKETFNKIELNFKNSISRLSNIKVGDFVYEEFPRFFDMEYFKVKVTEINIDEQYIIGEDTSQNNKVVTLYSFLTQEEFNKL